MKSNQPLLEVMDINLDHFQDIKLEPLEIGDLTPLEVEEVTLPKIELEPLDIELEPLPVNLDNTLFEDLDLTHFEELGGLV